MSSIGVVVRIAKRVAAVLIGTLLAASVPASASAFNVSITGAHGFSSGKTVSIKDTAGDAKSARAQFELNSYVAPRPVTTLTNSAGAGTTLKKTYTGTPVVGRVCTVNNNPFDANKCSAWKS